MKTKNTITSIEIIWPDITPMVLLISSIQTVAFHPKAGRYDDMVWITLLGAEKPMKWEGPRAEELYIRIKKILAPESLQF